MKFTVTISHPKPGCYVNGTHTFEAFPCASSIDEWPVQSSWYVTAPKFGCSKSYRTPEIAIREMAADHAGTVLSITRVFED